MLLCAALLSTTLLPAGQPKAPEVSRRGLLAAAAVATANPGGASASSFFGLAPEPITEIWSRETLLDHANQGHIANVQIAVQHDVVVATTKAGCVRSCIARAHLAMQACSVCAFFTCGRQRFACMIKDDEFDHLLLDAMQSDGSMPFAVLPLDANRAQVREAARGFLNLLGVLWLADCADLLPWDSTVYNSLQEREEAQRSGKMPEKPLARLFRQWRERIIQQNGPVQDKTTGNEALRRVLGLTPVWDAAGEQHLRLTPWVTPKSAEAMLPPLEELFDKAWRIHLSPDGRVAQYIRAHKIAGMNRHRTSVMQIRNTIVASDAQSPFLTRAHAELSDARWPVGETQAEADARGESHLQSTSSFDAGDLGVCRLCPDFSAIYGHNVYICKRLLPATA